MGASSGGGPEDGAGLAGLDAVDAARATHRGVMGASCANGTDAFWNGFVDTLAYTEGRDLAVRRCLSGRDVVLNAA